MLSRHRDPNRWALRKGEIPSPPTSAVSQRIVRDAHHLLVACLFNSNGVFSVISVRGFFWVGDLSFYFTSPTVGAVLNSMEANVAKIQSLGIVVTVQ